MNDVLHILYPIVLIVSKCSLIFIEQIHDMFST